MGERIICVVIFVEYFLTKSQIFPLLLLPAGVGPGLVGSPGKPQISLVSQDSQGRGKKTAYIENKLDIVQKKLLFFDDSNPKKKKKKKVQII